MSKQKIQETIEVCCCEDEGVVLADGFEDAFVGIARQFGKPLAVYDRARCIKILCKDMSHSDAEEYFQFNVEGAWVGEQTPVFLETSALLETEGDDEQ